MLTGVSTRILPTHFSLMVFVFKGRQKMRLMIWCYFQVSKFEPGLTIGIFASYLLSCTAGLEVLQPKDPMQQPFLVFRCL
jgi:hypothetical protein